METLWEIVKSMVLGIIQGVTEWLPISSTGHMILADEFINLQASQAFKDLFFVVIQFGSILAVILLYFHKLNPFSPKKTKREKGDTWSLWFKVLVAVIPAGVIGLLFDDQIHEIFYKPVPVAVCLIVYGIAFLIIESVHRKPRVTDFKGLSYKTALFIGVFQMLALIPGTSRSGATIVGALLIGCSRFVSAEFSFFLAVPTMLGASAIKLLKFFLDGFTITGVEMAVLIVGTVVSFLVSVFAIKFLMNFIKKHDFKPFGWYRIVLGILVILYFFVVK